MKKDEDLIELKGTVLEVGRNGVCKVETEQKTIVKGTISGKIRTRKIKILKGDKVTLLVNIHDITNGRITHREKVEKPFNPEQSNHNIPKK